MANALSLTGKRPVRASTVGCVAFGAQEFPGRRTAVAEIHRNGIPFAVALHGSIPDLRGFPRGKEMVEICNVLLDHYLTEGIRFLARLRGDFVLALWDGGSQTLYIATDRFRAQPLFYYRDADKLLFASRLKAIFSCPLPVGRTIDPHALVDSIADSIIPAPRTIYREVRKLRRAHYLAYHKGEVKELPYWDVSFLHPRRDAESTLARELREQFGESLSACLDSHSDHNRIGTFLSGGIDSSTLAGVLTQVAGRPVKTFSIGFEETPYNEMNYARIAAGAFGCDHHEYFVSPEDTLDVIPLLADVYDDPYCNASAVSTYYCAKMARENGVDILFGGDGGDELFAGNERYAAQELFEYYNKVPGWFRNAVLRPAVFGLAEKTGWKLFVKGEKYIKRASIPYHERINSYDVLSVIPIGELFTPESLDSVGQDYNPYALVSTYFQDAPARSNLDRHLYTDWTLTLADNDLIKFRMAEAADVSVRFPFLDHKLVEFSATVPAHIKMRGRELRSFFKRAYADLLPQEIIRKKKHGFGLPIAVWLKTNKPLNDMMHDLVLSPRSIQRGYFRKKTLEEIVDQHAKDATSFYGTVLWHLMMLELWHRTHFDR
jgi:asparagine synthase (glutamine-hydrolysing)